MKSLSIQEFQELRDQNEEHVLIDVREPHEFDEKNMGGTLIPLGDVLLRADEIPMNKKVIVHCRSGKRSANAIKILESKLNYQNLYNLEGGILAWENGNEKGID